MPSLEERVTKIEQHGSPVYHHVRVRQLAAYVFICALSVVGFFRVESIAQQGADANDAICALNQDFKNRIEQSQDFIRDKPQLLKEFGLTIKDVQNQIAQQRQTVATLESKVEC